MRKALLAAAALVAAAALLQPFGAGAGERRVSTQAHSGMTPPDEPMKGRIQPEIAGFTNAYGHVITPDEPEKQKKKRLSGGAYGGPPPQEERPLPPERDDTPLW